MRSCYLRLPEGPTDFAGKALTAASVDRIKPPAEGQIEIFDAGYPGLALRVSYGGRKSSSISTALTVAYVE